MDALYIYRHSVNNDFEIRYSLRSIELYAPYIRKVWIFGDRPAFLSDDSSLIECVPHEYITPILGITTPVSSTFLMMFLGSLIPDLHYEYLRFSDDFVLMKDFPIAEARKDRYLTDLSLATTRRRGLWGDSLWRTYETLKRLGYTGFNFEIHVPTYLTRKRVFDAYREFRDFVTADHYYGLVGATAILNHAYRNENMNLVSILDEESRFGFWGAPPQYDDIVRARKRKLFFNFDDHAFGVAIRRFLIECFPKQSRYEKDAYCPEPELR
jgi:Stealth protein CR2, conserved region 2